jgi:hypothetical protein
MYHLVPFKTAGCCETVSSCGEELLAIGTEKGK